MAAWPPSCPALALLPIIGGMMAGSASAALDWRTISAVLWQTGFGRVWRWHLFAAALLVVVCAIRPAPPGYTWLWRLSRWQVSAGSATPTIGENRSRHCLRGQPVRSSAGERLLAWRAGAADRAGRVGETDRRAGGGSP